VATPHSNKLTHNLTLCKVGDEKNREPAKLEGDFLRGRKVCLALRTKMACCRAIRVASERPSEARNLGYRCDHPSRAATRHIALLPVGPELKAGRAPTIPTASSLPCENPDLAEISSDFADVNIK
jgi:hypothetical protein